MTVLDAAAAERGKLRRVLGQMDTVQGARRGRGQQYPSLAAALATAGPARGEDDVFESCIMRLVDAARPDDHAGRPVR